MEAFVDCRVQIPPEDHVVPKHDCTILSSFVQVVLCPSAARLKL